MATIIIKNISKETIAVRPAANAEKVPLKPGATLECDRDYVEANCLKIYPSFFRAEGGNLPGFKEVITFLEKATDKEKGDIAKVLSGKGETTIEDVVEFIFNEATTEDVGMILDALPSDLLKEKAEALAEDQPEGDGPLPDGAPENADQNTTEAKDAKLPGGNGAPDGAPDSVKQNIEESKAAKKAEKKA